MSLITSINRNHEEYTIDKLRSITVHVFKLPKMLAVLFLMQCISFTNVLAQATANKQASKEFGCELYLKEFIANLDRKLSEHPRDLAPLRDFVKGTNFPICEESVVRRVFSSSVFFQSEWKSPKIYINTSLEFRFGTKLILVVIQYRLTSSTDNQFPLSGRVVMWKKSESDYH